MRLFRIALFLVHAFVASRLTSGAAVDRYASERQQDTSVINLLDTRNDRIEEDNTGVDRSTVEYDDEDEEYYDYYYEDEEDDLSGDSEVELPRVAMSSKPKDEATVLNTESTERKQRRGKGKKGKGKGNGKKRNPCLKKFKNYCIHGTCQYISARRVPYCVCHPNYSGERCEFITLPVGGKIQEGYSRTTALAVVAVVLSSLCLTIIGLLLALRFHKRGAYDIENEEKVKLGLASHH